LQPERLEFLSRFDSFYKMIIEQVKQNKLNESEFCLVIGSKAKAMERGRRERLSRKTIVIGAKKG